MNQITEKPVTLIRQEFIDKMINEVNTCQLPLFVIEPILQDLLNIVHEASKQQYEKDKAEYEQILKDTKEE